GIYLPDSLSQGFAQTLLVFFSIAYCTLWYLRRKKGYRFPMGSIGLTFLLLTGYTLVLCRTDGRSHQHLNKEKQPLIEYTAIISSFVQEKEQSWKVEACVQEIRTSDQWK
ncbi:hypothetical protein, partial [Staphylococcus aureus]